MSNQTNHNCEAQTAESGSRTFEPMAARRSERNERVSRKGLALSCLARAGRLNSLAGLDGRASARFDLAREGEQSGFRARTRTSSCNALSQIVSLAAAHTESAAQGLTAAPTALLRRLITALLVALLALLVPIPPRDPTLAAHLEPRGLVHAEPRLEAFVRARLHVLAGGAAEHARDGR